MRPIGSETNVYIFAISAVVILMLACINFINLSIASALPRSKESGVKRVLGSTARMIVAQFQTESFLVLLISSFIAVGFAWALMPVLNAYTGKRLVLNFLADPAIAVGMAALVILLALIAGAVPALTLLRSGTIRLLSGRIDFSPGKFHLGNVLIVFQFSIAVALIASTIIIMEQMKFMKGTDIGINKENLVMVPFQTPENAAKYDVWRTELMKIPSVVSVSASTNKVTGGIFGWRGYIVDPNKGQVSIPTVTITNDFFETLGAEVIEGRTFSHTTPADAHASYVINESAAALLGLKEPVGAYMFGFAFNNKKWTEVNAHIIGIVKDFHFGSMHSKIDPVVFSLYSEITAPLTWMQIRITDQNIPQTIAALKAAWSKTEPDRPFEFEFLDEAVQRYYEAEDKFMRLFILFSILSVTLGALGLFGLTAFISRRRTKEMGIRKTLGASTSGIVRLLSANFIRLVMLSAVIGCSIAWYFMGQWLQHFEFHTGMGLWIFVVAGILAIVIAFVAILYHALSVSKTSPTTALRCE
jgi:putative ABC transport system permease protein